MKVLILFAHPAFQKSRANRELVKDINKIEGITFHDLYQSYPEFEIDVAREKEILSSHDCIVFHHPFFWYSVPALLKEWLDLVLEHGWAYGAKGNALTGKLFFNAITAGGGASAYSKQGIQGHTVIELLTPLKQTAVLCKMIPLPPFVVMGTHSIETDSLISHREAYHKILRLITENKLDPKEVIKYEYLNDYISGKEN